MLSPPKGIKVVGFADDIVVVAVTKHIQQIQTATNEALSLYAVLVLKLGSINDEANLKKKKTINDQENLTKRVIVIQDMCPGDH